MSVTLPATTFSATGLTVQIEGVTSNIEADPDPIASFSMGPAELGFMEDEDIDAITAVYTARAAALMPSYTVRHFRQWTFGNPAFLEAPVVDYPAGGDGAE